MRCRNAKKQRAISNIQNFPKNGFATRAPKQKMIFAPLPQKNNPQNHFFEIEGVGTLINFI